MTDVNPETEAAAAQYTPGMVKDLLKELAAQRRKQEEAAAFLKLTLKRELRRLKSSVGDSKSSTLTEDLTPITEAAQGKDNNKSKANKSKTKSKRSSRGALVKSSSRSSVRSTGSVGKPSRRSSMGSAKPKKTSPSNRKTRPRRRSHGTRNDLSKQGVDDASVDNDRRQKHNAAKARRMARQSSTGGAVQKNAPDGDQNKRNHTRRIRSRSRSHGNMKDDKRANRRRKGDTRHPNPSHRPAERTGDEARRAARRAKSRPSRLKLKRVGKSTSQNDIEAKESSISHSASNSSIASEQSNNDNGDLKRSASDIMLSANLSATGADAPVELDVLEQALDDVSDHEAPEPEHDDNKVSLKTNFANGKKKGKTGYSKPLISLSELEHRGMVDFNEAVHLLNKFQFEILSGLYDAVNDPSVTTPRAKSRRGHKKKPSSYSLGRKQRSAGRTEVASKRTMMNTIRKHKTAMALLNIDEQDNVVDSEDVETKNTGGRLFSALAQHTHKGLSWSQFAENVRILRYVLHIVKL